jgi:DNA processing protein
MAGDPAVAATSETLPDEAWLAALTALPEMWPSRLATLLGLGRAGPGQPMPPPPARSAGAAWELLTSGQLDVEGGPVPAGRGGRGDRGDRRRWPFEHWIRAAANISVRDCWTAYRRAGVRIHVLGGEGYPPALAADRQAPYLVFLAGRAEALDAPRACIVGTRRCTPAGRDIAAQFGEELAAAGVCVVSGLALGIDGAAHAGALAAKGAPPAGVVAGGLDRPYPQRHRQLWRQVAQVGLLVSEAPLGTANEGWRFPARNRVLAALADVVVVVESHDGGGSMITADAALARGRTVLAVPGSIRSPASAGTNRLFREGAGPACDTADILAALALDVPGLRSPVDRRTPPGAPADTVLAAVDWGPTATETIVVRTGLTPVVVVTALTELEMTGWVRSGAGWWERLAPPSPPAGASGGHTLER